MRAVGLHIRRTTTLIDVALKAERLGVDFFQCFLTQQGSSKIIHLIEGEMNHFAELSNHWKYPLYAHASYFMNLSRIDKQSYRPIEREIELAQKLGMNRLVVHPGCAKGAKTREQGIDALAHSLNTIMRRNKEVVMVLENTAHGGMSIGSDITDFGMVLRKLDCVDRVVFCIDTAHAYVYGYDIRDSAGREEFIALVDREIGWQRVELVHLNDTNQKCASFMDKHIVVGKGILGEESLKSFIMHEKVINIPVLMELPVVDESEEAAALALVRSWHT